jgi:hypothetical protein
VRQFNDGFLFFRRNECPRQVLTELLSPEAGFRDHRFSRLADSIYGPIFGFFEFRTTIDFKIEFSAQPVFCILAILTHHDHGRLDGGQH